MADLTPYIELEARVGHSAKKQNLSFFAGDPKRINVTVRDENSALLDLTGATLSWKVQPAGRTATLLTKAMPIEADQVANKGRCGATLIPLDTSGLGGSYYHELLLTPAAGTADTIMYGNLTINRSAK